MSVSLYVELCTGTLYEEAACTGTKKQQDRNNSVQTSVFNQNPFCKMHELIPPNITQKTVFFQSIYIHAYSLTVFLDPTVRNLYNLHFFWSVWNIGSKYVCCSIYSPLWKRRACYNARCSICFCSLNGFTENERSFTIQHANDQRHIYHWPIATF